MTLRNKITFIVIFIWAILLFLVYFFLEKIFLGGYYKLENKQAYDNVERVNNALEEMTDTTLNILGSWAVWDDTYKFMQDKNPAYIKSNLTAESFASTSMDVVLYFDVQGKLFYSSAIDKSGTKNVPLPDKLLDYFPPDSNFVKFKKIADVEKGLISLPSGLVLIGSRPIVTSKNTGPIMGSLMMGKYFNSKMLLTLSKVTKLKVSLHAMNDSYMKSIPEKIKQYLTETSPYIDRISENEILVYSVIKDINAKPIYVLQIDMPRNEYKVGKETIQYYNYFYIGFTLLVGSLLWIFLQVFIIKRIEKFRMQFNIFHTRRFIDKTSPSPIRKHIKDELSAVSMLYYQATHDPLTGLANRNLLYQAFKFYTEIKSKPNIGIIFLDMYKFKYVNDTLGHDIGDELLIEMGKQLSSCLRENDLAARLGGDEFVLMLIDNNLKQIQIVIDRIFYTLSKPIQISGHELNLNANIGVSIYPDHGNEIATILKKADIALYKAKEKGCNNCIYYSDELNKSLIALRYKEIALQKAYDENQFVLYFQPIYHARSRKIICLEALIRWNHPEKGIVTAEYFIETSEKMGLIIAIGKWALNRVCFHLKTWQTKGIQVVPIAVNISAQQAVYGAMDKFITDVLDDYQIDPKYLELEITETGFIGLTPDILEDLKRIAMKGIKLSVDDFGIGYSGLGYLRHLPVDKLKIDKSFIKDIEESSDARAIVLAIISIAHQLNLEVIAEGVETEEQYQFLLKNDVDAVQGYLFSKPLSLENCETLLKEMTRY